MLAKIIVILHDHLQIDFDYHYLLIVGQYSELNGLGF